MAVTSADKLAMYNGALARLGERRLASLTENRKPRRLLDDAWGADNNAVRYLLERGEWNFAVKAVESAYTPSVEPDFGFARAHTKPSDFVRLAAMSDEARFLNSLSDREYVDEAGYWFTDYDTLFVRYVSDDTDYGMNSAAWPEAFRNALEAWLAERISIGIVNSQQRKEDVRRDRKEALTEARADDAMADGYKLIRGGSWSRARGARWSGEQE
jgi:hypothetical protein